MHATNNLSAICLLKAWYPNFFYCLLDFQCAKYGISLVQKGHLKIYAVWLGEHFLIKSLIFNIMQKSDLIAKRSFLNKMHADPQFSCLF